MASAAFRSLSSSWPWLFSGAAAVAFGVMRTSLLGNRPGARAPCGGTLPIIGVTLATQRGCGEVWATEFGRRAMLRGPIAVRGDAAGSAPLPPRWGMEAQ